MKFLFASDMSFNYMPAFPGKEQVRTVMSGPAALFRQADFSMLNLENIFGEPGDGEPIVKSGPNLISSPDYMEYIRVLNPTVVGLANNHAGDFGENPLLNTMKMLRDEGYTCIGAGETLAKAYEPAILEKDGIRLAVFAVCENEFGGAAEAAPGSAGYNLTRVSHAIRDAKREGCKPIIYFHGGNEHNPFPSPGKTDLYRHFIELGAEAVIAMHTHCPQGYEFYEGKPIVYSMGNFYFPTAKLQKKFWYCGYMTELNIEADSISLVIHPYRFDSESFTVLESAEKEEFLGYIADISAPIADPAEIQAWFDSWCLTSTYLNNLTKFKPEMFADGMAEEIRSVKNLFGCEAHNELLRNTLFMIYESRIEAARPRVEIIKRLQNMERALKK